VPDEERDVYTFVTKKPPQERLGDPLFLQQYAWNRRTKACIYIKYATKHNLMYPFVAELNLVREFLKKR
jgi:hypothetical protein